MPKRFEVIVGETVRVVLTQGLSCIIDAVDLPLVKPYSWHAYVTKSANYAMTCSENEDGSRLTVYMHRLITNARKGQEVDHADSDGLNNRRNNLRLCTRRQNQQNRKSMPGSFSKHKGVTYHKQHRVWYANITKKGKPRYLGCFKREADAARAYDKAAKKMFGPFARLNFPADSM